MTLDELAALVARMREMQDLYWGTPAPRPPRLLAEVKVLERQVDRALRDHERRRRWRGVARGA
jgi:hypothetical protein